MLHMDRIGIRELRQKASEYIRRAEQGETIELTDRGRPVARLTPIPPGGVLERLIAEGKAHPARRDLLAVGPPPAPKPGDRPLSKVVDDLREERLG
jgi:prevent-host-death family protein